MLLCHPSKLRSKSSSKMLRSPKRSLLATRSWVMQQWLKTYLLCRNLIPIQPQPRNGNHQVLLSKLLHTDKCKSSRLGHCYSMEMKVEALFDSYCSLTATIHKTIRCWSETSLQPCNLATLECELSAFTITG